MTTALFLRRFQPPRSGHLLTIRGLAERYDHILVGVTESQPSVMHVPNFIELMRRLLPEQHFSFIHAKGSIEDGAAEIQCDFDVCCSAPQYGNHYNH